MGGSSGMRAVVMWAWMLMAQTVAAEVLPTEAMAWWTRYQEAMVQGDRMALEQALSPEARVTVRVHEADLPMQVFTLSGPRFSQQLVMMKRFASRQQRQLSTPALQQQADGTLWLRLEMTERRQLFGIDQQQHDQLQILLRREQGQVRAGQIISDTRIR
jgi:hypothetical protein